MFVSSDGTWASRYFDAPYPNLYFSPPADENAPIKGDLENVEVNSLPLQMSDEKEVFNNWKEFSEDELKLGPNGKLSQNYQNLANQAAQGAFDGVNFNDLGYSLLGSEKS